MEEPPPPYSATYHGDVFARRTTRRFSRMSGVNHFDNQPDVCVQQRSKPSTSLHRFPREFGLYHPARSVTDYIISFHADDTDALFYISTHVGTSNDLSLILHSFPDASASPLATANLHFFSDTVAINIYDSLTSVIKAQSAETCNSSMMFIAQLPGTNSKTQFVWQKQGSWARELPRFDGHNHGMKLVNFSTKEIVATWRKSSLSTKKLGKMKFLAENRSKLGERFELMAVITLLSIIEKEKERGKTLQLGKAG